MWRKVLLLFAISWPAALVLAGETPTPARAAPGPVKAPELTAEDVLKKAADVYRSIKTYYEESHVSQVIHPMYPGLRHMIAFRRPDVLKTFVDSSGSPPGAKDFTCYRKGTEIIWLFRRNERWEYVRQTGKPLESLLRNDKPRSGPPSADLPIELELPRNVTLAHETDMTLTEFFMPAVSDDPLAALTEGSGVQGFKTTQFEGRQAYEIDFGAVVRYFERGTFHLIGIKRQISVGPRQGDFVTWTADRILINELPKDKSGKDIDIFAFSMPEGASEFNPDTVDTPEWRRARSQAQTLRCKANVKTICTAILEYEDKKNALPVNLQALVDDGLIADTRMFNCPGIPPEKPLDPRAVDASGGYYYAQLKRVPRNTDKWEDTAVIWDKTMAHGTDIAVGFVDGHVESCDLAYLEKLVKDHADRYRLTPVLPRALPSEAPSTPTQPPATVPTAALPEKAQKVAPRPELLEAQAIACRSNLKQVCQAIYSMAKLSYENQEQRIAPSLQALVSSRLIKDVSLFRCPAASTAGPVNPQNVDATSDYCYVQVKGGPENYEKWKDTAVLWDKRMTHGPTQVNVGFLNSAVRSCRVSYLGKLVKAHADRYAKTPALPRPASPALPPASAATASSVVDAGALGPNLGCERNLRLMADALDRYLSDHQETMPPSLQALVDGGYIKDVSLFKCPAAAAETAVSPRNVDATASYYLARVKDSDLLPQGLPVLWDKTAVHAQGVVHVLDYSAGALTPRTCAVSDLKNNVKQFADYYRQPPLLPREAQSGEQSQEGKTR